MSGLVERLRGERTVAARGEIALDPDKAREKMRMFRLPSPHLYVLQFVRAARILGAQEVRFSISVRETFCRFRPAFDVDLLADFWSAAFRDRVDAPTRAIHCLALGIGSAQALRPEWITVDTATRRLRFTDDGEELGPRPDPNGDTVIHVREKFRFGHLAEFLTESVGGSAEARAIIDYCNRAPFPIFVDGRCVTRDDYRSTPFGNTFHDEESTGWLFLDPSAPTGDLAILRDGVQVGTLNPLVHGVPLVGALESSRVETDISGMGIRPESVDELVHELVIPAYHAAVHLWYRRGRKPPDVIRALAIGLAGYVAQRRGVGIGVSRHTRALLDEVLKEKLFETAVSPTGPIALSEIEGPVRTSREPFSAFEADPAAPVVLVDDGVGTFGDALKKATELRKLLNLLAEAREIETIDCTAQLRARAIAIRNQRTWEERPPRETPDWPFHWSTEIRGVQGGIYLPVRRAGEVASVAHEGGSLYHRSRLLRRVHAAGPLGVWIDGDLGPAEDWSDIVRDDRVDELAVELCAHLPDLMQAYASHLIATKTAQLTPRLSEQLLLLGLIGRLPHHLFELLGYEISRRTLLITADERTRRLWVVEPRMRSEIEIFGALLDVPTVRAASGDMLSFREVLDLPDGAKVLVSDAQRQILKLMDAPTERPAVKPDESKSFDLDLDDLIDAAPMAAPAPVVSAAAPPPPALAPPREPAAALLDELVELLTAARGARRDLFDDYIADNFSWAELPEGELCFVSPNGVRIDARHPLVARALGGDTVPRAMLASVIYSRVNAWYQSITDHDELELQAHLLATVG